mmetsp:Transcript_4158/g.11214  ORF Transcript_4158/g.11214 Transcript_4158/m.11214 type:complete len:210 (+) Transcript_4158:1493-2122(+)
MLAYGKGMVSARGNVHDAPPLYSSHSLREVAIFGELMPQLTSGASAPSQEPAAAPLLRNLAMHSQGGGDDGHMMHATGHLLHKRALKIHVHQSWAGASFPSCFLGLFCLCARAPHLVNLATARNCHGEIKATSNLRNLLLFQLPTHSCWQQPSLFVSCAQATSMVIMLYGHGGAWRCARPCMGVEHLRGVALAVVITAQGEAACWRAIL